MLINQLLELPRSIKRALFFSVDTATLVAGFYVAVALRYGKVFPIEQLIAFGPFLIVTLVFGIALIQLYRLPQLKLHAFDSASVLRIASCAALLAVGTMAIAFLTGMSAPRSVPAIFGAVFFVGAVLSRVASLRVLTSLGDRSSRRQRVIIYGAGAAGIQLASALTQSREAMPVCFVDDNPNLHGLVVGGLKVSEPGALQTLVARHGVEQVLLAIPSLGKAERQKIIATLSGLGVEVKVLPSYVELMSGDYALEALRPVTPDDLLGRDKVDLDIPEITKAYAGRTIMVTGAGGSIGSELCRQLLNCAPAKIVLLDQSEFALYSIDRQLRDMAQETGITIVTRLGSVTNRPRVEGIVVGEGVEIILHAAAYKHVPLVEENELEGARNNVLGTQVVAQVAQDHGLERFILVSTDKAVRPTNIMGATKRMAELVIQDLATRAETTRFAMVRFGNVLGSSGSVLPLFETQIRNAGPVTVTHPEVTRFFMTIPEAARLVLLAGAFAKDGDVFVLDMGEPQKIMDIARRMIALSGRQVLDPETGEGDIEIEVVGLRPGEKLYEELLIDDDSLVGTPHPKILRATETRLSEIELAGMIREIRAAIDVSDAAALRRSVAAWVDGYARPERDIADDKLHALDDAKTPAE